MSSLPEATPERTPHTAAIVVDAATTKPDALAALALALDTAVEGEGTARPFVRLETDAWAEIDVPGFGEAPPLAIDVYSTVGPDHALDRARIVASALRVATGWTVRVAD